jgi:hypothetical protein
MHLHIFCYIYLVSGTFEECKIGKLYLNCLNIYTYCFMPILFNGFFTLKLRGKLLNNTIPTLDLLIQSSATARKKSLRPGPT